MPCLNNKGRLANKAETRKMSAYTVIYKTRDGKVFSKPLGNEKKFSDAANHAEKIILRQETTILALCRDEDAVSLIQHFKGQCAVIKQEQPCDNAQIYPPPTIRGRSLVGKF